MNLRRLQPGHPVISSDSTVTGGLAPAQSAAFSPHPMDLHCSSNEHSEPVGSTLMTTFVTQILNTPGCQILLVDLHTLSEPHGVAF